MISRLAARWHDRMVEGCVRLTYNAQLHDVEVPVPLGPLREEHLAAARDDFARIYDEPNGEGAGYREGGAKVTAFAVRGLTEIPPPTARAGRAASTAASTAPARTSPGRVPGGEERLPRYSGHPDGCAEVTHELSGPMLIDLPDTVAVLRSGQLAHFDEPGSLVITL